ncbi:MAG: 50S ribosomal protein L25/general stress protein Ctc [Pseudomonadota bacterium]
MSNDYIIDAEPREDMGKGASRRLRRTGRIPAIMYGAGKEPENISLDHNKMFHSLEDEGFFSHILTVNLTGKKQKVIVRDLQRHPAKPIVLHMDFQRVSDDQEVHIHVPLHFIGEDTCPGVKLEGGQISHHMIEVEISCLPKNIPEYIEVDVSDLNKGDSIHLSELKLPEGVVLTALTHGEGHDQQVVDVHATKVNVEEEEPSATDEETPTEEDNKSEDSE